MKKVFSNSDEVIHIFAQQSQSEGTNSSRNVFFERDTKLYSYGYHYLLCEFIDNKTVMINDTGYSVTTSKHVHQVRYATSQYKQFFKTETDIDLVHSEVLRLKNRLAKANKPELYIKPILALWESLNEFLVWSKAKRYKSNAKYKEIKKITTALNDDSEGFKDKLNALAKKQAKAKAAKDKKNLKEALTKFENYEINSFRVGDKDFLRISADGTKVETSQRVSIKIENALSLYKMIDRGINIAGKQIEHYKVTSINGTLKIGCHNINIDSVHKVGKMLLNK